MDDVLQGALSEEDWLARFKKEESKEKAFEALKLYRDSRAMLEKIKKDKMLIPRAVIGLFPANSVGDDIEVYDPKSPDKVLSTFYNIREQQEKPGKKNYYCLSDFITPKKSGVKDYI